MTDLDVFELRAELDAANEEIAKLAGQLCDAVDAAFSTEGAEDFHQVAVRVMALRSWLHMRRNIRNRMRHGAAA